MRGSRSLLGAVGVAGLVAMVAPVAGAGMAYWSDAHNGSIWRSSGPGGQHELVVPNAGTPWGIAVDPLNRHVYWGDTDGGTARKISRANYDGSGQVVVLSEDVVQGGGTQFVQGLSVDAVNGYLYYTEGNTRTIRRVRTDGGGEEAIVQGRWNGPIDVKLDVANGYMYWTQIVSTHSELYRARLDGSEQQLLFSDQGFYYDLALAPAQGSGYLGKYIYFADQHPDHHSIRRIGIDGSDPTTLITLTGMEPSGLEIDPVDGMLYWSRRDEPGVWRATLDGEFIEQVTDPGQFPDRAYTIDFTLRDTAAFAAALAPEPGAVGVIAVGVVGALGRRRRSR